MATFTGWIVFYAIILKGFSEANKRASRLSLTLAATLRHIATCAQPLAASAGIAVG
ncbi:MAG: hypothetical protein MUF20_05680 [Methylotetracoccus sp.]|nr:hypothetical protein [Methylotetracoccus sp.]